MKSLICFLLFCVSLAGAQSPERAAYLKGYEERARAMTVPYDTSSGYGGVAARYAHNVNIRQADSMFVAALKEPRGDMFWMFPVIGAYFTAKGRCRRKPRRPCGMPGKHTPRTAAIRKIIGRCIMPPCTSRPSNGPDFPGRSGSMERAPSRTSMKHGSICCTGSSSRRRSARENSIRLTIFRNTLSR